MIYDDIVTIMEQTWPHLSDPLRSIVRRFVNEARDSGSVDTAFSHMRESIESRQLRSILTNLQTTSHFNADYRGILRVISVDMNDYMRGINERSAMIRRFKVHEVMSQERKAQLEEEEKERQRLEEEKEKERQRLEAEKAEK